MILRPIIVKNVRGIPRIETTHKVANLVIKLGLPLLSHVMLRALVAGLYTMICYEALA